MGLDSLSFPPQLQGSGSQEAGTEAHTQARTTGRQALSSRHRRFTCKRLAAWLPQQLWAGSWELRDTSQPCPITHALVEQ